MLDFFLFIIFHWVSKNDCCKHLFISKKWEKNCQRKIDNEQLQARVNFIKKPKSRLHLKQCSIDDFNILIFSKPDEVEA